MPSVFLLCDATTSHRHTNGGAEHDAAEGGWTVAVVDVDSSYA